MESFLAASSNIRHPIVHSKLGGYRGETLAGGPQPKSPHNRRRQQMNFNPADATAVQISRAYERDHIAVRNIPCLIDLLIGGQEFPAASLVAYQKFSVDQFVPADLIEAQQPVQLRFVGSPIGKSAWKRTSFSACWPTIC